MDVTAPQEVEAKLDGFTQLLACVADALNLLYIDKGFRRVRGPAATQATQLQIALKNTRRARRARAWPRNQFWFESLLQGDFMEDCWKENFRILRRSNRSLTSLLSAMIETLGRKRDNRTICSPRDLTYYTATSGYICHLDLGYQL